MAKKDLVGLTTDLSALAAMLPTQRAMPAPVPSVASEPPALKIVGEPESKPPSKPKDEPVTQFSLSLRTSLRKELARLAADADMTMRAFVLNALKEKGLHVRDDDLADLRKERR